MIKMREAKDNKYRWEFKARFRRHSFGWRSQPAIQRIKQAVSEIKKVARKDEILGAEGAVIFLERVSPALEHVDGSSGAIGTAVNNAITELVPLIAKAPADAKTRDAWLYRLWEAHEADSMPYIEGLGDYWGELCASDEVASVWANQLLGTTRMALSPNKNERGHFHGTTACLSALYRAGRYDEILRLLDTDTIWLYNRWASDGEIDEMCEELLLSSGLADEAYERYGIRIRQSATYLGTFRALARKYPHKSAAEILTDLVRTTPGEEGKWFAAAKNAGLYDEALALATQTPCDPRTLARAAREFADKRPAFALSAGLLALYWIAHGYGYEITGLDVWAAYDATIKASEKVGTVEETRVYVWQIMNASNVSGENLVKTCLAREFRDHVSTNKG